MSMLHGRQRGKNRSLDGTIIRNESDNKLQEGTKLHELGKRFEADKAKLEKEITKVQNAKISEADKKNLIAELEGGIALLQEQYDKEVAEEEAKIKEELEDQIESMQEAADEFEKQADSHHCGAARNRARLCGTDRRCRRNRAGGGQCTGSAAGHGADLRGYRRGG